MGGLPGRLVRQQHLEDRIAGTARPLAARQHLHVRCGSPDAGGGEGAFALDLEGLRPGMVIKEVDHQNVKNAQEFAELLQSRKDSDSVLLLVYHDDHTRFVVLKIK